MAELDADRRRRLLVHEVDDPAERCGLLVSYSPQQAGVIRPSGDTQAISVITRPAPPSAFPVRWVKWKSPGTPSSAMYMSIADTTTRFLSGETAQPERLEHRRPDFAGADAATPLVVGEPLVHPLDELVVAHPQVVVGDPPAPGHDVEREPHRLLIGVLAEVLEPLEARLSRALGRQHHRPSFVLVRGQRRLDRSASSWRHGGQREGVLHGELRSRADREVRGVGRIAKQDDVFDAARSALRTVAKLTHRELLASTSWPSEDVANSSHTFAIDSSSDSPGRELGTRDDHRSRQPSTRRRASRR